MKLSELSIEKYMDNLSSDSPAPGGGSAAALCGAQGASLAAMVAGLTIGKKKYEAQQIFCLEARERALALSKKLTVQIDLDTEAFNKVSAAFKLPKESEEDKAARRRAIAAATLEATRVPFGTMELALECLKLAKELVGNSNASAVSDLGVAALNLLCCLKGAWLNVLINLEGIGDENEARGFSQNGEAIVAEGENIANGIYEAVAKAL